MPRWKVCKIGGRGGADGGPKIQFKKRLYGLGLTFAEECVELRSCEFNIKYQMAMDDCGGEGGSFGGESLGMDGSGVSETGSVFEVEDGGQNSAANSDRGMFIRYGMSAEKRGLGCILRKLFDEESEISEEFKSVLVTVVLSGGIFRQKNDVRLSQDALEEMYFILFRCDAKLQDMIGRLSEDGSLYDVNELKLCRISVLFMLSQIASIVNDSSRRFGGEAERINASLRIGVYSILSVNARIAKAVDKALGISGVPGKKRRKNVGGKPFFVEGNTLSGLS